MTGIILCTVKSLFYLFPFFYRAMQKAPQSKVKKFFNDGEKKFFKKNGHFIEEKSIKNVWVVGKKKRKKKLGWRIRVSIPVLLAC